MPDKFPLDSLPDDILVKVLFSDTSHKVVSVDYLHNLVALGSKSIQRVALVADGLDMAGMRISLRGTKMDHHHLSRMYAHSSCLYPGFTGMYMSTADLQSYCSWVVRKLPHLRLLNLSHMTICLKRVEILKKYFFSKLTCLEEVDLSFQNVTNNSKQVCVPLQLSWKRQQAEVDCVKQDSQDMLLRCMPDTVQRLFLENFGSRSLKVDMRSLQHLNKVEVLNLSSCYKLDMDITSLLEMFGKVPS